MGKTKGQAQPLRHQKVFRTYSDKQVTDAVVDIRRGMSIRAAVGVHCIPFSSLRSFKDQLEPVMKKMGPKPLLSDEYEQVFVDWILSMKKFFA